MLPIGACIASYHLLCCILETDLSAELPSRSQYQCCFHNCAKSAYYYMSLYIKGVLINFPQEFAKYVSYSYCSVHREFKFADMNMVKLVNKLVLKFLIFNSLKEGFLMDLNYVRRFSAYVSTFYYSEYITVKYLKCNCLNRNSQFCGLFNNFGTYFQ